MAQLVWTALAEGLQFQVLSDGDALPVEAWGRSGALASGSSRFDAAEAAHIGPLLRLLEEDRACEQPESAVLVNWEAVADLSVGQLKGLGLPPRAPLTLALQSQGSPANSDFRVSYKYVGNDGIPRVGIRRIGALLNDGTKQQILPNPLFQIVEDVDRLNETEGLSTADRMLAWGRVTEIFPEDLAVDDYLRSYRITVASAFTIEPFLNDRNEPDLRPVLGRLATTNDGTGELSSRFRSSLTPNEADEFELRFRKLRTTKLNNPLGENRYIVLAPEVLPAIQVVRDYTSRGPAERREFLEKPSLYLREALENSQSDVDLDSIFSDEGLSERVRGIGIWEPRILPWIQRPSQDWLPPEKVGLLLGSLSVEISPSDLPVVEESLKAAITEGRDYIVHAGERIPATNEALEAIAQLRGEAERPRGSGQPSAEPEERVSHEKQILLIRDNLEELGYQAVGRARPGTAGGLPECLCSTLLSHQKTGVEWMQRHWIEGSTGALLADDMGLGKTLQALTFLAWTRELDRVRGSEPRPILVVAPTGLLKNWVAENEKHLTPPGLGEPLEVHGKGIAELRHSKSRELTAGFPTLDLTRLREADWVLTTYETLRDYQHSFARIGWSVAVFDEAQRIKNPTAGVTNAALAMNLDFCIVMTGTPVENRPADIWPIVDRAHPGRLGTLKEFSRTYESPDDEGNLTKLKRILTDESAGPPIMFRRLKEEHLDGLPERHVHRRVVEMPPIQADAYTRVVERAAERTDFLAVLQDLRAVSLHPMRQFEGAPESTIEGSARLREALRALDQISAMGEKALLFCEAVEMQDFLIELLPRRYRLPGPVRVINGKVPGAVRRTRVDEFQRRHGFDVMLLSPRAGGVGLTLTAANHVIHLSRWWNPAVEDQCTDRVLRIGQERPVHIYIPLARHPVYGDASFDLKLDVMLQQKRSMSREVLLPPVPDARELESLYRAATGAASAA